MIATVGCTSDELQMLFQAFATGSRCDPTLPDHIKRSTGQTCHGQGWGYALYDGKDLRHFRSSRPVWQETFSLPPTNGTKVQMVLHSRLASNAALNLPIHSHPYMCVTDQEVLFLAHNGGVQEDAARPNVVDSEWVLSEIARRGIEAALADLKRRTKANSALNIVILKIPRDNRETPAILCLNSYKGEESYYGMFTATLGNGRVFMSSTFAQMSLERLGDIQKAPRDELFGL
jgi:predicted glutamine amidotransferase